MKSLTFSVVTRDRAAYRLIYRKKFVRSLCKTGVDEVLGGPGVYRAVSVQGGRFWFEKCPCGCGEFRLLDRGNVLVAIAKRFPIDGDFDIKREKV